MIRTATPLNMAGRRLAARHVFLATTAGTLRHRVIARSLSTRTGDLGDRVPDRPLAQAPRGVTAMGTAVITLAGTAMGTDLCVSGPGFGTCIIASVAASSCYLTNDVARTGWHKGNTVPLAAIAVLSSMCIAADMAMF